MRTTRQDKPAPATPATGPLRRRATLEGFYNGQRVKKGSTFTLRRQADHSDRWMETVDPSTPDDLAQRLAGGEGAAKSSGPKGDDGDSVI